MLLSEVYTTENVLHQKSEVLHQRFDQAGRFRISCGISLFFIVGLGCIIHKYKNKLLLKKLN